MNGCNREIGSLQGAPVDAAAKTNRCFTAYDPVPATTPPYTMSSMDINRTELESDFGYLVSRVHSMVVHSIMQRTLHELNVTAAQGRLLYC